MIAGVLHDGDKLRTILYDHIGKNGDYEPFNLEKCFDTWEELREWIKPFRADVLYLPMKTEDIEN